MTAYIDADSIVYIVAYNFRDEPEFVEEQVRRRVDNFIETILLFVKADTYFGVLSAPSDEVFRTEIYKFRTYKGNRPEKPEFITKWSGIIKNQLVTKWKFHISPNLEADDIVIALACLNESDWVICSPDKDLRQLPGLHYDYSKATPPVEVTRREAVINFWTQMLTGDSTDNIVGIPGLGAVKARKLLEQVEKSGEELTDMSLMVAVRDEYTKYFGLYYGSLIFTETLTTVKMIQPDHLYWPFYNKYINRLSATLHRTPEIQLPDEYSAEADVVKNLGWADDKVQTIDNIFDL